MWAVKAQISLHIHNLIRTWVAPLRGIITLAGEATLSKLVLSLSEKGLFCEKRICSWSRPLFRRGSAWSKSNKRSQKLSACWKCWKIWQAYPFPLKNNWILLNILMDRERNYQTYRCTNGLVFAGFTKDIRTFFACWGPFEVCDFINAGQGLCYSFYEL